MHLLTKTATAALIATTVSCFADRAGAAPLSAPLALRDAITPTLQTVQWRGGGWHGGWGGGWHGGWGGWHGGWGLGVGVAPALSSVVRSRRPYYGYNYGYYAPSYYGSYSPPTTTVRSGPYGGYRYGPYYRGYRYAPRFYGGYWPSYGRDFVRHPYW